MKWFEDPVRNEAYAHEMHLALAITLGGNILLAAVKWVAAATFGSSALQADAWNSISDVLYSLTLIIGLLISIRPADLSHPHGHERFEPVVGLVISLSMGWAGFEAFRCSVEKLLGNAVPIEPGLPILVLLFSAGIKCLMFFRIRKIAEKISSKALGSAAEDNLMDTLTSAAAAAGILLSRFIHPLADPVAGLLLAVWILRGALKTLVENLNYLTGHGADSEELNELRREIEAVPVLSASTSFSRNMSAQSSVWMCTLTWTPICRSIPSMISKPRSSGGWHSAKRSTTSSSMQNRTKNEELGIRNQVSGSSGSLLKHILWLYRGMCFSNLNTIHAH